MNNNCLVLVIGSGSDFWVGAGFGVSVTSDHGEINIVFASSIAGSLCLTILIILLRTATAALFVRALVNLGLVGARVGLIAGLLLTFSASCLLVTR